MIPNLVSTIIPVFNRPGLLREAVASVMAQTYRPIEIIIADDGSTDATGRVADSLHVDYPQEVRVLHLLNGGPGKAREAGRRIAKGEFIQYLDSDDLLLPRKFELQVAALKEHQACGVAYGKTRYYRLGEDAVDRAWKRTGDRITMMFPAFLQARWWDTSSPLYRRDVIDKAGEWLHLQSEEDWEYDCRIASQGVRLCFVDNYVSDTRHVDDGMHLGQDGTVSPTKLKCRAQAHAAIFHHAQSAGITADVAEMQHFARELFLLSRQCGAAGLAAESQTLFELARQASTLKRAKGLDFTLYHLIAQFIGWRLAGRLSCWTDRFRR